MSGLQLDDLEELLRIAREYERMGRFRDAAVAYDQALVLFRDNKRAKEGLRRSGKIEYVRRDMRHRKGIMFIDWSPDSRYLLTASSDGVVNIWNVESERIVRVYKTAYVLSAVDWSVDGKYIAMGEKRGMVVIRDAFTGRKIAELDENYLEEWIGELEEMKRLVERNVNLSLLLGYIGLKIYGMGG